MQQVFLDVLFVVIELFNDVLEVLFHVDTGLCPCHSLVQVAAGLLPDELFMQHYRHHFRHQNLLVLKYSVDCRRRGHQLLLELAPVPGTASTDYPMELLGRQPDL